MITMRGARRIPVVLGAMALTVAAGVAGCTAEQPAEQPAESSAVETRTSTPAVTPTPDPTAAAAAAAAADEKLLPMPASDIEGWAEGAVPDSAAEGFQSSFRGWLSQNTSPRQTNIDGRADPGSYLVQFACRGDGTLTMQVSSGEGEPASEEVVCENSTTAFAATIPSEGLRIDLTLEGAPTVYAVSFQHAP